MAKKLRVVDPRIRLARRDKGGRKPIPWNKRTAAKLRDSVAVNIGANLAATLALSAMGGGVQAHYDARLTAIEGKLDRIAKALTMDPAKVRLPAGYRLTWDGKKRSGALSPAAFFCRALLLGLPFRVNGIEYRPVRKKGAKP